MGFRSTRDTHVETFVDRFRTGVRLPPPPLAHFVRSLRRGESHYRPALACRWQACSVAPPASTVLLGARRSVASPQPRRARLALLARCGVGRRTAAVRSPAAGRRARLIPLPSLCCSAPDALWLRHNRVGRGSRCSRAVAVVHPMPPGALALLARSRRGSRNYVGHRSFRSSAEAGSRGEASNERRPSDLDEAGYTASRPA